MGNVIEVVAAVVRRKGRVLIASRKQEGWEFPGGKIEPGETRAAALRRELEEELSIRNALVLDELFQICRAVGPDGRCICIFCGRCSRTTRRSFRAKDSRSAGSNRKNFSIADCFPPTGRWRISSIPEAACETTENANPRPGPDAFSPQ